MTDQNIDFFEMDLSNVQPWDGTSSRIEAGTYVFEVTEAVSGKSKSSGQPMITLTNKVVSEGPMMGKEQKSWVSLSEKARGRLRSFLDAAQIPYDNKGFSVSAFVGAQYEADVREEPYQGTDDMGQPVTRMSTKIVGERTVGGAPVVAPAPVAPAKAAPAAPAPARAQVAAKPANGRTATR